MEEKSGNQTLRGAKDLHTILEGKENDPDEQDSVSKLQPRNFLTSPISIFVCLLFLDASSPTQLASELSYLLDFSSLIDFLKCKILSRGGGC